MFGIPLVLPASPTYTYGLPASDFLTGTNNELVEDLDSLYHSGSAVARRQVLSAHLS